MHKSSLDKLNETTKMATNRLKNVRKNINSKIGDNFSLGRSHEKKVIADYNLDRPQTVPANDELFQSISFNSPLKAGNCYNLNEADDEHYEVPRKSISVASDLNAAPIYPALYSRREYQSSDDDFYETCKVKNVNCFERNTDVTQSMVSTIRGEQQQPIAVTRKIKNQSESNLYPKLDENPIRNSTSSDEYLPCPSYPAPVNESIYGRLLKSIETSSTDSEVPALPIVVPPQRTKRRKEYEETSIRPKPKQIEDLHSNRATVDSAEFQTVPTDDIIPRIFSRDISDYSESMELEEKAIPSPSRSESWAFYDANDNSSSPEPIYANEETATNITEERIVAATSTNIEPISEPVYGELYNMESPQTDMLTPQAASRKKTIKNTGNQNALSIDIIREFDPLLLTVFDQTDSNKSNELILLETLLGHESYGTTSARGVPSESTSDTPDISDDEGASALVESNIPQPPMRQDSLDVDKKATAIKAQEHKGPEIKAQENKAKDIKAQGIKELENKQQENKAPENKPQEIKAQERQKSKKQIAENRATVIIHQNMKLNYMENILAEEAAVKPFLAKVEEIANVSDSVDLSRPEPKRTNWFVDDEQQQQTTDLSKSNNVNPANKTTDSKVNKVNKVIKNPINISADDERPPDYAPPPYSEVFADLPQAGAIALADDKPKTSMKSMFSNVLNKMEGINLGIKRKPSFKATPPSKSDVKTIIKMVPKPLLSQRHIQHEGSLVRLPSGVVDDILKEQHMRKAFIRERKFQAYYDKELKTAKENFSLDQITTIQCVSKHKFTNNSSELHCFEITTATGGSNQLNNSSSSSSSMSNPNMVMTSTNSGNSAKSQRITHLYGVSKESDRFIWMQKLLESMTDVFQSGYTCKFYRAGWCYLKVMKLLKQYILD